MKLLLCLVVLLSGFTYAEETQAKEASLYTQVGGQPAIDAAVDLFYVKVLADEKVSHYFDDVNMKRQAKRQKQFLAAALGGPVPYTGKSMEKAHKGMKLTEADFNAIAGHLVATLNDLKIDKKLIGKIMTVVATTKDSVINK